MLRNIEHLNINYENIKRFAEIDSENECPNQPSVIYFCDEFAMGSGSVMNLQWDPDIEEYYTTMF